MENLNKTRANILYTALELFSIYGIKKTTMEDIAIHAGVTRNTIYTYFKNKKLLVEAAYMQIVAVFQDVYSEIQAQNLIGIEAVLDKIDEGLTALPHGNYAAQWEELKCLYPDLLIVIQDARTNAINDVFEKLSETQEGREHFRVGLNPEILRLFFMEAVINLVNNPRFAMLNLDPHEIYSNVREIFLYGIMEKRK
jgi:AcrR family transcriptional regulator